MVFTILSVLTGSVYLVCQHTFWEWPVRSMKRATAFIRSPLSVYASNDIFSIRPYPSLSKIRSNFASNSTGALVFPLTTGRSYGCEMLRMRCSTECVLLPYMYCCFSYNVMMVRNKLVSLSAIAYPLPMNSSRYRMSLAA